MAHTRISFLSPNISVVDVLSRKVFEPAGVDVFCAGTVNELEEQIAKQPPELILISEGFQDFDTMETIRSFSRAFSHIPVVVFAPKERNIMYVRRAIEHGAADCLIAPLQTEDLLKSIQHTIENRAYLTASIQQAALTSVADSGHKAANVERLAAIGRAITSQLDADQILTEVVSTAVQLTNAEEGLLLLLDEDNHELYLRASYKFIDPHVRTFRIPTSDTLAGQVVKSGKPVFFDRETPEKIKTHYLVHSLIYVPIQLGGHVIGVLGVDNRKKPVHFKEYHVEQMQSLGDYAAIALQNAALYEAVAQERNDLETILTRVADGVMVVNDDRQLVFANQTARQIFDITQGDYVNQPVDKLIDQELLLSTIEDCFASNTVPRRLDLMTSGGQYLVAQFALTLNLGLIVTMQDVTHFKELDKIKNEFINTVSHDLRSPLTAILGYTELINRAGPTNDQQREYMRRVQTNVQSITALIHDLLDLGRIESGVDAEMTFIPVHTLVGMVIENLQFLIQDKEHDVVIDVPETLPKIKGDSTRLRQVLANLLDNAIKYTPPKGQITIRAYMEDKQMIIQVADTGIGVAQVDQPYIFNKLYRGDNIPANISGSGLGLAIVKSVVESHHGRYWFESEYGKGSTFSIVLPLE